MLTQIRLDPERRATYREIARQIIGNERAARKAGCQINTIDAIERALVAAFLEGYAHSDLPKLPPDSARLTWIQIPPRSRNTLSSLTFRFSAYSNSACAEPLQIERFFAAEKWRWRVAHAESNGDKDSIADGSVQPLIRLGLIQPTVNNQNIFCLTAAGIEISRDYWKRHDEHDPTLPKISLR